MAPELGKQKVLFTSKDLVLDVRVSISGENLCRSEDDESSAQIEGVNEVKGGGGPVVEWKKVGVFFLFVVQTHPFLICLFISGI